MTTLGQMTRQARIALTTRRNCSDQHSIAHLISCYSWTKFINYTDGFMSDDQPWLNRIFPAKYVEIGAADSGQGHTNHGFTWSRPWLFNFFNPYPVFLVKDSC
jgi:hypothetical protein